MDISKTISQNGIVIRLTNERWRHITMMHPRLINRQEQVLGTISDPEFLFLGDQGELLAVIEHSKNTYLVVIYKEDSDDGFIITAFETEDTMWVFRKKLIWSKHL